jgi:5'-3' exonuclease
MQKQPIKQKIKEAHPEKVVENKTVLIVDGSNLLTISLVDKKINSRGEDIGGVFQFMLQLKMMLKKYDWDSVYVFFDGDKSGILRYKYYSEYKANRDKNYFEKSGYNEQIDNFVKRTLEYSRNKKKQENPDKYIEKEKEKASFERQKLILLKYFEELSIRWMMDGETESDDLIAYYVMNKKPEENIVIMSSDADLTQLISDSVIIYSPNPKIKGFITTKNHKEIIGYTHENVLLKKIITGDVSDNIKGIKGVGENTLMKLIPEIKDRKVTLEEVINKAKTINEERKNNKQKPLLACENIINGITDGVQGKDIYEINDKIINLKKPLLTKDAEDELKNMMHNAIDPTGRSFQNLYKMIVDDDITEWMPNNKFSSFFADFKKLVMKEEKFYEKNKQ